MAVTRADFDEVQKEVVSKSIDLEDLGRKFEEGDKARLDLEVLKAAPFFPMMACILSHKVELFTVEAHNVHNHMVLVTTFGSCPRRMSAACRCAPVLEHAVAHHTNLQCMKEGAFVFMSQRLLDPLEPRT